MRLILLHPLDWFKTNAFQDTDGDWWRYEVDRDRWEGSSDDVTPLDEMIYSVDVGVPFEEDETQGTDIEWGIKETITPDTHPEYFL